MKYYLKHNGTFYCGLIGGLIIEVSELQRKGIAYATEAQALAAKLKVPSLKSFEVVGVL